MNKKELENKISRLESEIDDLKHRIRRLEERMDSIRFGLPPPYNPHPIIPDYFNGPTCLASLPGEAYIIPAGKDEGIVIKSTTQE